MSWYADHEDLDSLLETIFDVWSSDRANEWRAFGEEKLNLLDIVDNLANSILRASEDLVAPHELEEAYNLGNAPSKILEEAGLKDTALEGIQVMVGQQYCTKTRRMAERVLELSDLVLVAEPNETVRKFLGRLGRSYIAGFLPECVMLCRGTLENALTEKYQVAGIPPPRPKNGPETLETKIDGAEFCEWIDDALKKKAHIVRVRGNKAVHNDPEAVKDVYGTIRMTSEVLASLYD